MYHMQTVPKRFETGRTSFSPGSQKLSDIKLNAYNYMVSTPFFTQSGTTSPSLYTNTRYTAYAEIVFSGQKGSHPPYWEVWAEDLIPFIKDPSPNNCFADKTEDITLSWGMDIKTRRASFEQLYEVAGVVGGRIIDRPRQKSAVVRWKQQGSSTVHTITVGEETQVVIPQGEITGDSFDWQVVITTDDNVQGSSDVWYHATTNNDAVSSARAVSPQRIVVDGSQDIEFVWEHIISTATRPTRSELQYSLNRGAAWKTLADVKTRETRCIVSAGTMPAGLLQWRVRTYNTNGAAGQWSEAVSINSYSAPPKPQILSVSNNPLPKIRWSGEGQLCAEVRMDGEKTQRLYGSTQSLVWDTLLADGEHQIEVRIENSYSLWSPWAQYTVRTKNYAQEQFALLAKAVPNGVELRWEHSFPRMDLYRDGQKIAELHKGFSFLDWESIGTCRYELYGISEEGYYTKSSTARCAPNIESSALGDAMGSWISLSGRYYAPPEHRRTVQSRTHFEYYLGRTQPVAYPSSQREILHRFSFSLKRSEHKKLGQLEALSGRQVLYKDVRGDFAKGTLHRLVSSHNGQFIEVQFDIVESQTEQQDKFRKEEI